MKAAFVFLFLFLSSFALKPSGAAASALDPVLDIKGDKLRTGVEYYILPVIRGRGGGLTLDSFCNETCPLDVVQEKQEISNGLPLTFSPVNVKQGVVHVSTDLNIKFSAVTICVQSTVWTLDRIDESTGQSFITTGGVEGNPGRETLGNWFKIEKFGNDYKLFYCPGVCDICRVRCSDVGIYTENGRHRLVLNDTPFRVMFKKAQKVPSSNYNS